MRTIAECIIMSINFASSSLQTRISCSTVSVDGSEVANLITDNPRCRSAGFLAEAFVNPPVHITLSFPCAIDIHRVVVNGQLSSHRSIGFQLHTAVSSKNTSHFPVFYDQSFRTIGRCISANVSALCFTNVRYKERDVLTANRKFEDNCSSDGVVQEKLHHPNPDHLSRVSAVTLSVTRTANGSAVAVKSLEVWGQPAAGTPCEVIMRLKRDVIGRLSPPSSPPLETSELSSTTETSTTDQSGTPPEYLDAITCELMSLPILLPSGMAVDRSTLEKHISAEAQWGRPPSDPFTGRLFGEGYKPIVHSSLKARLDRFATMDGEGDSGALSLPRVLGSIDSFSGLVTSRLVAPPLLAASAVPEKSRTSDSLVGVDLPSAVDGCRHVESADRDVRHGGSPELLIGRQSSEAKPCGRHNFTAIQTITRSCVARRSASGSEESRKRTGQSYDTGHPTMAKRSVVETVPIGKNSNCLSLQVLGCSKCSRMENVYRLPCSHHVCRQCLATQCPACGITFTTSDPVRVHY